MKHVVLIPDSYKGTMSSMEICEIMDSCIRKFYPKVRVSKIPVADGGEGSVDCFLSALGGERVRVRVCGPYFEELEAYYGLIDGGKTAVIETASCAGLPLVGDDRRTEDATTFGVGQLMADAIEHGCKKLILCLGGSATTDLGAGAAAALGIRFFNRQGKEFVPTGRSLSQVAAIDASHRSPALQGIETVAMCDIDNPLYGKNGAAHVFAPQKGAGPETVDLLDEGLRCLCQVINRDLKCDIATMPGSGAAGGLGGGAVAFWGAQLQMGIDTVLDITGFDRIVQGADLVFTGEGRLDSQSLRGKVVVGVARRTKPYGVPVIAVVGDIGDDIEPVYDAGVSAVFSINRVAVDFSVARGRCKEDLRLTMENLIRFVQLMER